MELMKNSHSVYQIGYHIVFCTKYRNNILKGPVYVEVKKIIGEICYQYNWKIKTIEIMPDHVHLFIQIHPTDCINHVVQTIKSISAVHLFGKFPNLKKEKFWGSGLWSKSTYYGTVGHVSEKTIQMYIENQKSKT